jgi:glycosyltransferase involved in cell wall biosynthesis
MRKIRIGILSRFQNISQRGAENFVSEFAQRLENDFEIEILTGKDADDFGKIVRGKFDLVIPINGRMQSLKASLGRVFGKYKVLISGHSGIGRDDLWNIVVCRPNVFVALTDLMLDWARFWGKGVKKIKIPDGVDLDKFSPSGQKIELDLQKPVILSVGALAWYKHHELAIEAVRLMDNGSLLIVGKGPDKEKLKKIGKEKLRDRFQLIEVDYQDMPRVYRAADVFTLPSWNREAFGMVYLEALASGLPVVAPNDRSRKEIVGNGGILVDVDNAEKYAQALEKALSENWGEKPRIQARKFSWEIIAENYKRIILALIE